MATIIKDEAAASEALAIVERYEAFLNYLYPIAQRAPRRHGLARDALLAVRRDSVTRARRKIEAYRAAGDDKRLSQFLGAWTGHASWADSHNLLKHFDIAEDGE